MRQPSGDQNGLRNCPREEQVLKRESGPPKASVLSLLQRPLHAAQCSLFCMLSYGEWDYFCPRV